MLWKGLRAGLVRGHQDGFVLSDGTKGAGRGGGGRHQYTSPPAWEPGRCFDTSVHSAHVELTAQQQSWGGERGGMAESSCFESTSIFPHLPWGGRQEAGRQHQSQASREQFPATV